MDVVQCAGDPVTALSEHFASAWEGGSDADSTGKAYDSLLCVLWH